MKIMPPSKMIGRWIYTHAARHRFLVERDVHQIVEDAIADDQEPDVCKNCNQERALVPDTPFCHDCYADMDDDDYDDNVWLPCGCHYTSCTCEGSVYP